VDVPHHGHQAMSVWMLKLGCAGMLVCYAVLIVRAMKIRGKRHRMRLHIDPFVVILELNPVLTRLQPFLQRQRLLLSLLNGGHCSREMLLSWAAEGVGLAYIALLVTSMLAMQSSNLTLLLMGFVIACCLPILKAKELSDKVNKRRQTIVMELPELLSKLLLMVNAGENVMRALTRAVEQKQGSENPLYLELKAAIERIKQGDSMSIALEEMGRRCAVPEVKMFATTLLINARRGGDAFVPALRELTRQMWERRKALARILGEQASTRLAFPLTVVFFLIMVLVGAPTILMM